MIIFSIVLYFDILYFTFFGPFKFDKILLYVIIYLLLGRSVFNFTCLTNKLSSYLI